MMRRILALSLLLAGCASFEARILDTPFAQSGYIPTGTDLVDGKLKLFVAHVEHVLGATVEFSRGMEAWNAAGMTSRERRAIHIDDSLPNLAKIEVLAHEAAHLLGPPTLSRSEGEVFADAVSVETCRRMGLATTQASVRYLAQHKHGLHVLRVYRLEIAWAATVLSGR